MNHVSSVMGYSTITTAICGPNSIHPQKHQEPWFINLCPGILGERLLGAYLLSERLAGHSYLIFLCDVLPDFLDDILLVAIQGLWSKLDGDPAHFYVPVFYVPAPGYSFGISWRWIGIGGPLL
ncbi:hypothetical protein HNY73_020454 [Argiope bruennichi]|uniref:Uncharacterized protein n=1 Tax=Argiope bruennichi TaxID=94029 RepID=A0A8T0E861_ARGBR|nr:hypothetical protein HNY73_020454 [Argiope bruennichi]